MSFEQWLLDRDIDQQHLEPDMEAALLGQYEADASDPETVLVLTDDELWAHAIREPAV